MSQTQHPSRRMTGRAAALWIALLVSLSSLLAACGGSTTTSTSTTPSLPPGAARGVFLFPGQKNPADATKPGVAGADLLFNWKDLEPAEGSFDWQVIDSAMQPWLAAGKLVILRVHTATRASTGQHIVQATPQWVFDAGARSVTEIDGSVLPVYWDPIFQQKYAAFIQAFAARYDGNPHILCIQIGMGIGGETIADSIPNPNKVQLWQRVGYSNQTYLESIGAVVNLYKAAFHKTPLALMVDKTFIQVSSSYNRNTVLTQPWIAGLWLEQNGLSRTANLPEAAWHQTTLLLEQVQPAQHAGYPLLDDIQRGAQLGAKYLIVFTTDVDNPSNANALAWIQHG